MKVTKLCSVAVLVMATACTEKSKDYCDTSMDCPLGQTCLTETHTCVTSSLTVSPDGFFVADGFWWSTTSGPQVKGTVSDPKAVEIIALVGGVPASTPATIDGSDWSLTLNDMTIGAEDTEIYFQLTGADGISSITQTFRLDSNPPVVALEDGHVFDEREDTINYGSSEPVHTHGGTPIALSADECTDVYRYGYLLTDPKPQYGEATNANPIVYRFKSTDETSIDMSGAEYRVLQAGTPVLDWTPIGAPDETGSYVVAIDAVGEHRVPELATVDGQFDVEVRYSDLAGNVSMTNLCWNHHVLAAPIEIVPMQAAANGDAIPLWRLTQNSPVSLMINPSATPRARLFETILTQRTAESVVMKFDVGPIVGNYQITVARGNVPAPTPDGTTQTWANGLPKVSVDATCYDCNTANTDCINYADPICETASTVDTPYTGAVDGQVRIAMVDLVTSAIQTGCSITGLQAECQIPPRGVNDLPRQFALVITLHDIASIKSKFPSPVAEQLFQTHRFTGTLATPLRCSLFYSTPVVNGRYRRKCSEAARYNHLEWLDRAVFTYQPFSVAVSTGRPMRELRPLTTQQVPQLVWDAGDDNIPY